MLYDVSEIALFINWVVQVLKSAQKVIKGNVSLFGIKLLPLYYKMDNFRVGT